MSLNSPTFCTHSPPPSFLSPLPSGSCCHFYRNLITFLSIHVTTSLHADLSFILPPTSHVTFFQSYPLPPTPVLMSGSSIHVTTLHLALHCYRSSSCYFTCFLHAMDVPLSSHPHVSLLDLYCIIFV